MGGDDRAMGTQRAHCIYCCTCGSKTNYTGRWATVAAVCLTCSPPLANVSSTPFGELRSGTWSLVETRHFRSGTLILK